MNVSAICGLDSDVGFKKRCGLRAIAHERLLFPVSCSDDGCLGSAPPGRLQVYGFLHH